jgi:large subunit ribosomal protein L18
VRAQARREAGIRRHRRVRKRVTGTADRPRLVVYRSNRHIYAQLVDDARARTLAAASDVPGDGGQGDKSARAKRVGQAIAEKARGLGVERVVFDRGGRLYHGRVRAVAEGAREGGLRI